MTTAIDLAVPERALVVVAHPDDAEFGAGATLAKWSAAGCRVSRMLLTDGSKGTWDPDADLAGLIRLRQAEQRAAAAALGTTGEVVFLGRVDGELEEDRATRSDIAREIRRLRPQVVLGHDPWRRYRLHPDHRHAGFLTVDAVVAARDPHFFPEHDAAHHRPDTLLLFEADEPDHLETAGHGDLEARCDALLAFSTQLDTTHFHRLDDGPAPGDQVQRFRAQQRQELERMAAPFGHPLGESFRRLRAD